MTQEDAGTVTGGGVPGDRARQMSQVPPTARSQQQLFPSKNRPWSKGRKKTKKAAVPTTPPIGTSTSYRREEVGRSVS